MARDSPVDMGCCCFDGYGGRTRTGAAEYNAARKHTGIKNLIADKKVKSNETKTQDSSSREFEEGGMKLIERQ